MNNHTILYYIHDPMCSWCWGFKKVWAQVQTAFQKDLNIQYLAGGLAPDSDQAMPAEMQQAIAGYWRDIQARIPGTEFNFDFWESCQPRRSTYPACRAAVSARQLDSNKEADMIEAIQQAYYLQAQNPSDVETLVACAGNIGLDTEKFEQLLVSDEINDIFFAEMRLAHSMGAQGFPSLVLKVGDTIKPIFIDYNNADTMIQQINQAIH